MFSQPLRTILAFDSSAGAVSCAVWRDGHILAAASEPVARGHGEVIMGALKAVMAAAELEFSDLSAIAVTEGPGSFTGIRVGLAAARGLALALGVPVLGVSTLKAHAACAAAQAARSGATIMVVVDSKRADLFVQHFSSDLEPLDEPHLVGVDALGGEIGPMPMIVTGDAGQLLQPVPPGAVVIPAGAPDIRVVVRLAADANGDHVAAPLYIRPPDAATPIAGGRLR